MLHELLEATTASGSARFLDAHISGWFAGVHIPASCSHLAQHCHNHLLRHCVMFSPSRDCFFFTSGKEVKTLDLCISEMQTTIEMVYLDIFN